MAIYTVTNTNDSGAGSLRDAINTANGTVGVPDTINLTGVNGTITLTSGQLDITDDLVINGPGASNLTVSGNNASQVFNLATGPATVTIDALTIASGSIAGGGGGIYVNGGDTLFLTNSTITGSYATNGAGIYNLGTTTITNSSISGNSASNNGGGIYNKSDIDNNGTVTVINSTISGNSASSNGGGIWNYYSNPGGFVSTATISNSTISGNSAQSNGGGIFNFGTATISNSTISSNSAQFGDGGGIFNFGTATTSNSTVSGNSAQGGGGIYNSGTAQVGSSIVAGNSANKGVEVSNSATFTSNGNNLVGQNGSAGGFPTIASDIVLPGAIGTAIAPLANNGGFLTGAPGAQQTIQTQALVVGSPAIDKGVDNGLTNDERGTGFLRVVGAAADIGAFEFKASTPTSTPIGLPDLTISKTASPQLVTGSQAVTYTLTVSNIGAASASNITVRDSLPSGLTFFTATATGGFNTPSAPDASGNLNFTGGTLALGASATLTVVVTTPNNLPTNGYTNTATVDPLNVIPESNESNNTASVSIGAIAQASPPPNGEPLPPLVPLKPPTVIIPAGFIGSPASDLAFPDTTAEGKVIEGTLGNDTLTGGAGDDTIRGKADDDIIYGYGGDNLLIGGRGNDVIWGGKGNNTLIGVSPSSPNPGRGERDILTGGPGNALFVLGDSQNVYYDDGNNANPGLSDYALITDFNLIKDKIQLKSGLNYVIGSSPSGLPSGAGIYIDNDGIPGLSANDELIGLLLGVSPSDASIISSRFSFV